MRGSRRELNKAVEDLYRVFAPYDLRAEMDRCDHCVGEDEVQRLQSCALRELLADLARRYAFNAISTWGDEHDFKHFLPRLSELLVIEPEFGIDPETLIGKLRYARWNEWPTQERQSIQSFLAALWEVFLSEFPSRMAVDDADSCLCAIAQSVDELEPHLRCWQSLRTPAAARHLAAFVECNEGDIRQKGQLGNPWWKERRAQMNQVLRWLFLPATKSRLEDAFYRYEAEPFAEDLSQAVQWLDWLAAPQGGEIIAPDSSNAP